MNVNLFLTTDYENISNWTLGENKPNSNPILERMNVNFCAAGYYESKPTFAVCKGRPNNPNLDFTTAWSSVARIVTPEG